MKKILGLDLGTNSIGWALVEQNFEEKQGEILGMGSRIIPMDAGEMGKFAEGGAISKTADRTKYRSTRRLYERNHLRRERLHRALNVLGFLPEHYANDIDFEKRFGKFKDETETKLVWKKNGKKDNGKDKFEFIFQKAFGEMLEEFKKSQPDLMNRKNRKGEDVKIPYDWTIYYLRKKALEKAISKEELAWLILNFNQKRGYYQLRGEEEEINENKKEFVVQLKIVKVEKGEVDKRYDKKTWYAITFENGWEHSFPFTSEPNWLNTEREFLVVEEYDNGNIKIVKDRKKDTEGREKRTISTLPSFEEIDLMSKKDQDKIYKKIKARTELTIENSKKTVGTYIYENLLQNPTQKIRGKLVRTIERKFYKEELKTILEKQIELQPELFTDDLYNACVRELYKSNEAHQQQLSKRDFVHLFLNDIIFYQRPLKSQKSSIGNCSLEFRLHKINKKDGNGNPIKNQFEQDANGKDIEVKEYLKAIPKSNPYYQEFRVWQWLYNLKIYTKKEDKDVTGQFIKSDEDKEKLFEFLMAKKEVNHTDILTHFIEPIVKEKFPDAKPKSLKAEITKEIAKYRWNYVFDDSKDKEDDKSKKYPMNETGCEIRRKLKKEVENVPADFLTREIEQQLWHIIYSVTDKIEFETALESFARKHSLYHVPKTERNDKNPDKKCFVYNFKKLVWKETNYGAYSEKAIKKLLPLMRIGKYWNWENIDTKTQTRIDKLLTGEFDEEIQNRVREKAINLTEQNHFQGLQLWLAQYAVYDRHSEATDLNQWQKSFEIQKFLYAFKQHSLRNPIVEQVVTETLRVVKDIWEHYGEKNNVPYEMVYDEYKKKKVKSYQKFFSEIHVELGREMKNTADDRKRMTSQISDNENTNQRIKLLLMELKHDSNIENVREYSPTQQEILKIYEEYAINNEEKYDGKDKNGNDKFINEPIPEDIVKISKTAQPTKAEINRYKLWLEQKYRSPYTGQMIPLSKLFTSAYEIEHVIPKSRYFDDSLSNKVICESAVNKLKDNQLGLEFIKNHFGQKVTVDGNKEVTIFTEEQYKTFIDEHYAKNKAKRTKFLLEEIPDKMIARQMNDTRYISKFISQVLSNIVRADKDDDGVNSKNIIPGNGKITTRLKQDWGLNDVWNELVLPRFERMNILTKEVEIAELEKGFDEQKNKLEKENISDEEKNNQFKQLEKKFNEKIKELDSTDFFITKNKEGHTIPAIPFKLSKGFQKKRIDHRHHAMDALVIACATRSHVNYLNNVSAKTEDLKNEERKKKQIEQRNKLKNTLCYKTKPDKDGNYKWIFEKPWENFTTDTKNELEKIVVSFKQVLGYKKDLRVINKATNKYEKIENGKKVKVEQKGTNWAIRKPMHEETVSGLVNLPWVKLGKGEFTTATRKSLDKNFNLDKIEKVTDIGIQTILRNYLTQEKFKYEEKGEIKYNSELAFSPEGIEELNKNISQYNNGKFHQPIFKVRTYEKGKGRFVLGEKGNKKSKYVQGAPNLFSGVYSDKDGNISFETIPLDKVIERQKQKLNPVPEKITIEKKKEIHELNLQFHLSPDDLVYVPTKDEQGNLNMVDFNNLTKEQKKRIFFVNDFSGSTCYFRPNHIAKNIVPKEVDLSFDEKKKKPSGSFDTKTANLDGNSIKDICIKLKVDRLGNISKA